MRYFKGLKKYLPLLKELVVRDIKTRYRRSVLGLFWTLLNPLLMMIILTIVFSNIFRQNIENFPVYLLCGQVIFNFFSEATTGAMNAILGGGALIRKVYVPKYLFVFSKILSTTVNLVASFFALFLVMLATGMQIKPVLVLSLVPMMAVLLFAAGMGLILATVAVFFRDMLHFYGVFLVAWMYLTPIFYPIEILPKNVLGFVEKNPIFPIISCFRTLVLEGTVPDIGLIVASFVPGLVTMILGLIIFYRMQDRFILHI